MSSFLICVALESQRLPIHHPQWTITHQTLLACSIILVSKKLRLLDTPWVDMLPWLLQGFTPGASVALAWFHHRCWPILLTAKKDAINLPRMSQKMGLPVWSRQ